jgi:hypothetical protein
MSLEIHVCQVLALVHRRLAMDRSNCRTLCHDHILDHQTEVHRRFGERGE